MRKVGIAAGALALALTLGACGGDSITGSGTAAFDNSQQLVAAAKQSTAEKKSAKFTMSFTGMGQTMNGSGVGRFDGANSAMSMTMQLMGQNMEMRLVDRAMYMKMPGMPGTDPAKSWIKMSLDDVPGGGAALENSDPAKVMETLVQSGTIKKSEETQLDGKDVVHYVIDVDVVKMMDQMGGGQADAKTKKMIQDSGIKTIPMELWLDSENLPVQMVMDMGPMMRQAAEKSGSTAPAGTGEMKMTLKYSDWGTDVAVEAPPADQVSDFKMPTMPN